MSPDSSSMIIRAKIIGVLIRDARLKAKKSIVECANSIGIEQETLEQYELGVKAISLPELELLAYYLQIPIDHFWEKETFLAQEGRKSNPNPTTLIAIRQRMIGAMLRQARLESGVSIADLADRLGLDPAQVDAYELGLEQIPLPTLELLSSLLNRSIHEFQDKKGPVGVWNAQQRALQDFQSLPVEIQTFISKPVNRPYLDLAVRLSEMSVDRLRAVAEGLLEITY
jgi:transcriptional regulator with XRE-family HTH domain